MRRSVPALVLCCLLAACTGDAGVTSERANAITTTTAEPPPPVEGTAAEPPAPGSGTGDPGPDSTTGDTDPAETTEVPDTTEPPDTADSTDTTDSDEEPDRTDPPDTSESPLLSEDGVGDALFPDLGNPGIDVEHYDVALRYDPDEDSIAATVTLTIVPTEDRTEFTLDSEGPDVTSVLVDGAEAEFVEEDVELRITPASPLVPGTAIEVAVEYTATPDPDESVLGLPNGWFHTDGGSYVLNEPDAARTWLPSNDHPGDKATYRFTLTVPKGVTAVANGALVSNESGPDGDTWVWEETAPMATYLILLLTGEYELVEGTGPNGLPLLSVVLREDRELMQPFFDTIDEQIDFFDDFFGTYPFERYGLAFSDSYSGLAMETQERALFSRDDFSGGELDYIQELLLSHELAHMWFGNAVTLAEWQDIWLNEAFATYAEWMWLDHIGMAELEEEAELQLEAKDFFATAPTGRPTADEMFGFNTYQGGAVVLHALREELGDDDMFFTLLERWAQENKGESRHTEDFIALAEDVSGEDLEEFFDDWLFAVDVPEDYPS